MKSSNFPCILLLKPKERTVQNMSIILKTTNFCKSFNGQTAVNNISMNIERNSVYGLLGPNGAGKSTTLKMITGILRPTSGSKDDYRGTLEYRCCSLCRICGIRIEYLLLCICTKITWCSTNKCLLCHCSIYSGNSFVDYL